MCSAENKKMEKEDYLRMIRNFRDGELSLCNKILNEASRRGDYDLAQEALDAMKKGHGEAFFMKTLYTKGGILSYLRGPKGAVQFLVFVSPQSETDAFVYSLFPADVGYHSFVPIYEGMTGTKDCMVLEGAECFYEGSGLRAIEVFPKILEGGENFLREFLEEEYKRIFG